MDNFGESKCEATAEEVLQNNFQGSIDREPVLGLEFDDDESAFNFYNEYARRIGFSVRKEYVNINKKLGYVTSRKLTCFKEGFRGDDKRKYQAKNPRKETRTGCQAHIVVTRQSVGKYQITKVELEHNHPLVPPTMIHMLPSHRNLNDVQTHEIDLAEDAGLFCKGTFDFMSLQAGGRANLGYTKLDHKNYLRTKRQKAMGQGEAGVLLEYFEKKRVEDPSFFFAVQLDVNDMITNIFWADSKMIIDYEIFGDVVSFDTTYQTNKEHRPLASFVGFNNHRKMIIFRGALMYDETSESFQWLFETFLRAMSGKAPKTIFTDQDAAMSKAISFVMPEVHHRLCVWHMEQNAAKHLNQVYKRYASFRGDFRKCIYEYEDEGEFINAWTTMLDEYNLHENEWLQGIYALREKLFAAYRKQTFSGGMNSTQLSESLNSELKDYLQSDYNLVQFFKHYDRAIEDKRYNELQDTCDASQRLPILKAKVPILLHAREVYTANIFSKFQDEYMKSLIIKVNGCEENNFSIMYKVSKYGHTREHIVKVTEADHISCTCMKFESMGILCCHTIRILDVIRGVDKIPDEYILKRWTKMAKTVNIKEIDGQDIEIKDSKLIIVNRYRILCPIFVRMAAKASETDEGYKLAATCVNELSTRLKQIMEVTAPSLHTAGSTRDLPEENNDRDLLSQAKSFKKKDNTKRLKKRIKTSLEANSKSKKARGKKSDSINQNGSTVDDRTKIDKQNFINQDSTRDENFCYNFNLSASQSMARANLSQHSEFSLSTTSYSFTQMLTEPSYFDALAHTQNSCSLPHDQASFFESQGAQEFRDNYF